MAENWPFITGASNYSIQFDYDGSGNQIYVGWALPGTSTSSTGWRIMNQVFNGTNQVTAIQWPTVANGSSTGFDFIWANRTTYSYS